MSAVSDSVSGDAGFISPHVVGADGLIEDERVLEALLSGQSGGWLVDIPRLASGIQATAADSDDGESSASKPSGSSSSGSSSSGSSSSVSGGSVSELVLSGRNVLRHVGGEWLVQGLSLVPGETVVVSMMAGNEVERVVTEVVGPGDVGVLARQVEVAPDPPQFRRDTFGGWVVVGRDLVAGQEVSVFRVGKPARRMRISSIVSQEWGTTTARVEDIENPPNRPVFRRFGALPGWFVFGPNLSAGDVVEIPRPDTTLARVRLVEIVGEIPEGRYASFEED